VVLELYVGRDGSLPHRLTLARGGHPFLSVLPRYRPGPDVLAARLGGEHLEPALDRADLPTARGQRRRAASEHDDDDVRLGGSRHCRAQPDVDTLGGLAIEAARAAQCASAWTLPHTSGVRTRWPATGHCERQLRGISSRSGGRDLAGAPGM